MLKFGKVFDINNNLLRSKTKFSSPRGPVVKAANHLKHSKSLTAVGSSLARVTCGKSQVLLADGHVVYYGDLPFSPHLTIDSAQNG